MGDRRGEAGFRIITARQAHGLLTLAIGAALFYSSSSFARPDLQPLGTEYCGQGSAFYHFTQRQYDSADGERHYRVWTAVPDKAPPTAGYPVLYMLDGNAVMDKLNDAFLRTALRWFPAGHRRYWLPDGAALRYRSPARDYSAA